MIASVLMCIAIIVKMFSKRWKVISFSVLPNQLNLALTLMIANEHRKEEIREKIYSINEMR